MIRRYAVAGLALLALGLVCASAEAGGTSGAVGVKKNATVRVYNSTKTPYYVVVLPSSLAESSSKFGTPGTLGWAKNLGGVLVNGGKTVPYPVPAGPGGILWVPSSEIPKGAKPSFVLPEPQSMGYEVGKGKTVTKTITSGSTP